MDLFGFARDIGRRVFNTEDEAVGKIKELIEQNNPGVTDLGVEFDNGIVGLSGTCNSVAAMQKCALIAGNVQGVADVYTNKMVIKTPAVTEGSGAEGSESAPAVTETPAEPKVEFYVIESGDTLGKIAQKYYGKASAYMRIFEANREVIEDPDKIFVGQTIRIPLD
ncbi:MAG: LysM peptidoglycan-binding domain-containing protein [Pseudomonadota bacterium]